MCDTVNVVVEVSFEVGEGPLDSANLMHCSGLVPLTGDNTVVR